MAKGQYKKWLEPDNLVLMQGWKRSGLTDEEIAQNIGIRRETLYAWKNKYPNINNALKRGKEQSNFLIENVLFRKALSGNVTAMIFYLKNNWRDKYNDSELSPEERKLAISRQRKIDAETELTKLKAKAMKDGDKSAEEAVDRLMDVLEGTVKDEHKSKQSSNS